MSNPLDIDPAFTTEVLVRFLREELASAGFSRALVGLSGGIDSAVSLALAARAFGPDEVLGVMMPYRTSNPDSEAHARLVARELHVPTRRVDISAMVDGYLDQESVPSGMRRGNVMARMRMVVLYDLSEEWRGLVIGTSNKTEMLLGYSTLWGDSAHAVNPLGDLYKHQVYQLARHLEIPTEVVDKPPSADLFEGQTDEDELGFSYAEADRLLYPMIDERHTEDELVGSGFDRDFIRLVAGRIVRNQYKRVMPVIAKLSHRTINQDFRYLRDWKS
ncbi:MAG: NAD+ synthase [Planctomycetota bacterium]|nr:NAD+ synthase [Planctomycetota bacterium]